MKKVKEIIRYILKLMPIIMILAGILLFLSFGKHLSVKQIINNTPENKMYAVAFIMLLYSFKSISVLFPVSILYIVTGMLFPIYIALVINIIGIFIGLTLPYLIGFFSGEGSEKQLVEKYPRLNKIHLLLEKELRLIILLLRLVGFIPMDILSIFLGSIGISYDKYLFASVLGILPSLITTTYIGSFIDDPSSSKFIISITVRILILIISIIIYRIFLKNKVIE